MKRVSGRRTPLFADSLGFVIPHWIDKHEGGYQVIGTMVQWQNDYANPVAARKLPFQKPVVGNSGSAFCSLAFCSPSACPQFGEPIADWVVFLFLRWSSHQNRIRRTTYTMNNSRIAPMMNNRSNRIFIVRGISVSYQAHSGSNTSGMWTSHLALGQEGCHG